MIENESETGNGQGVDEPPKTTEPEDAIKNPVPVAAASIPGGSPGGTTQPSQPQAGGSSVGDDGGVGQVRLTNYSWRMPGVVALGIYLLVVAILGVWFLGSLMTAENPPIESKDNKSFIRCGNQLLEIVAGEQTESQKPDKTGANSANAATEEAKTPAPSPSPSATASGQPNPSPATKPAATSQDPGSKTNSNSNSNANKAVKQLIPRISVPSHLCIGSIGFISEERFFTADSYLFLIVLFAGMVGGAIRGMASFFRHIGVGDFSFKWTWYYVLLPFTGAVLSLVIYFVIRGGFYGTSFGEGLNLNVFAFAGLAALTGLFSENAMEKLRQIASTLLTEVPPKVETVGNSAKK